jgi:hypothetical protein
MKYLFLFFASFLLLFVGCSNNNLTEPASFTDSQLKAKIIGTWSNDNLTITYEANNNFQEKINYVSPDLNTQHSEVIEGVYNIQNGILSYAVSDWNIADTSAYQNGLFSSMPDNKIQIDGNKIVLYPVFVLTRLSGDDNDIWGEWKTTFWSVAYNPGHIGQSALNEEQTIFRFNQDSMTVSFGTSLAGEPIDSVHFNSAIINYNPPYLSWPVNYNKKIEFHNGLMYMFEKLDSEPYPLSKVK